MDFDALVLGPAYSQFGRDATLTLPAGSPTAVRVIDNTAGVAVLQEDPHGFGVTAIKYTVHIRKADLGGVAPKGGTLLLGGTTWNIASSAPVIGPNGVGTGEQQLFLTEPASP